MLRVINTEQMMFLHAREKQKVIIFSIEVADT
jgi:hypothetical protein